MLTRSRLATMLALSCCAGLVTAALGIQGAAAARPPRSPVDRIAIVTANVLEGFDPRDLRDMSEMKVFAKRVLDLVPYRPDVLLLQEVNSKSSHYIARLFSRRTGDRYVVVADAGKKAYREKGNKIIKSDTSIVMNKKTMAKAGDSGYIVTVFDPKKGKTEYKRNARALVRERGGTLSLAMASVHVPKAGVLKATKTLVKELPAAYPTTSLDRFNVLGGDFNKVGVHAGSSYGQLDTDAFWELLTETHGYGDSGYNVYESKFVDYVFVQGGVWGAGVDGKYNPKTSPGSPGYYSDHQFRWAIVGPDVDPPTTPGNVDIRARQDGGARIKVTWNRSRDNAGIAAYDIYRSTDGVKFRKRGTTGKLTFYDEKVDNGQRYWYFIHARDWSDNLSVPSVTVDERA